jgi:hypothetical protein
MTISNVTADTSWKTELRFPTGALLYTLQLPDRLRVPVFVIWQPPGLGSDSFLHVVPRLEMQRALPSLSRAFFMALCLCSVEILLLKIHSLLAPSVPSTRHLVHIRTVWCLKWNTYDSLSLNSQCYFWFSSVEIMRYHGNVPTELISLNETQRRDV